MSEQEDGTIVGRSIERWSQERTKLSATDPPRIACRCGKLVRLIDSDDSFTSEYWEAPAEAWEGKCICGAVYTIHLEEDNWDKRQREQFHVDTAKKFAESEKERRQFLKEMKELLLG